VAKLKTRHEAQNRKRKKLEDERVKKLRTPDRFIIKINNIELFYRKTTSIYDGFIKSGMYLTGTTGPKTPSYATGGVCSLTQLICVAELIICRPKYPQ
jgi:hypothetical protein